MTTPSLRRAFEDHANLKDLLQNNQAQAPSVCQTLNDLTHAQKWQHVQLLDMTEPVREDIRSNTAHGNVLICGLRPEAKGLEAVWPCMYSDDVQTLRFKRIFDHLDSLEHTAKDADGKTFSLLKDHFLLAVYSTDATVVYYNIARGLVKPIN